MFGVKRIHAGVTYFLVIYTISDSSLESLKLLIFRWESLLLTMNINNLMSDIGRETGLLGRKLVDNGSL